jgi:hypothetical protein
VVGRGGEAGRSAGCPGREKMTGRDLEVASASSLAAPAFPGMYLKLEMRRVGGVPRGGKGEGRGGWPGGGWRMP